MGLELAQVIGESDLMDIACSTGLRYLRCSVAQIILCRNMDMACLSIERHFYPDLCIDTVCIRDIVLADRKFAVNDLRQGFPIPFSLINKGQFNVAAVPGLSACRRGGACVGAAEAAGTLPYCPSVPGEAEGRALPFRLF